ncbi:MAG: antitoxin family protein [Candidatus Freyarchaeota archaeon]
MGEVIEVIYENGVFKPLQKVRLREGALLRIEIKETKKSQKTSPTSSQNWRRKSRESRVRTEH